MVQQEVRKKDMVQNNYVPDYIPDNLPWYERDRLMTYIDKLKCGRFLKDPDKHFKETKVINFDIICKTSRGGKIPDKTLKDYQNVKAEMTKSISKKRIRIGFYVLRSEQIEKIFILKEMQLITILKDCNNQSINNLKNNGRRI